MPYSAASFAIRVSTIVCGIVVLLMLIAGVALAQGESKTVSLTIEERAYLEQLGPITVAPDPDWVPFEHVDADGNFTGIAADLLDLVAQRLGIGFSYVIPADWDEALALSRSGEVLILPFLNQTPAREAWLTFTEPLFIDPNVFITRNEHPFITDLEQLGEATVALPSGTSIEERLRRDYPQLRIVTFANEADVFRMIEEGRADLTLRSLTIAAYTIRRDGWFNLRINGQAPEEYINYLRIGVLNSEPQLRDILNKGIATITPREREQIANRHVNITVVEPFDYGLVLRVAAVVLILIVMSLGWNYRLRQLNAQLIESERSKALLIANLPGLAYRCKFDSHWTMLFISDGCRELTGHEPAALISNRDLSYADLIDPAFLDYCTQAWAAARATGQPAKLEYPIITADGTQKWVLEQGVVLEDVSGEAVIEGLIIDISNRKQAETRLYHTSTHDELTGLYNRRFMLECLDGLLKFPSNTDQGFLLAIIDVDHFKRINDQHGHLAGDFILNQLAQLLRSGFREQDRVGRYGGEEFVVVVSGISAEQTQGLFTRLLETVRTYPFEYDGHAIRVTISAGIVNTGECDPDISLEALLAIADRRLYDAKAGGRDCFVSDDEPPRPSAPPQ